MEIKVIARIYTDFKEKFGIPRQSGIAEDAIGKIVFEPEYRRKEALRGIEEYSHLWLIWEFSKAKRESWTPTVRPPRLGGNKKIGVFATRSPFRPNPIGLSSVKLLGVLEDKELGQVLIVGGADILDGTPIYDVKPYLAYTDSHPDAKGGFSDAVRDYSLEVEIDEDLLEKVKDEHRATLIKILSHDPRPAYKDDENYEYGMKYADYEIFFTVKGKILKVNAITGA